MAQALQRMQQNWQQALGEVEARGVGVNLTFETHYRSQLNLILLLKIDEEKSLYFLKCQISVYIYVFSSLLCYLTILQVWAQNSWQCSGG